MQPRLMPSQIQKPDQVRRKKVSRPDDPRRQADDEPDRAHDEGADLELFEPFHELGIGRHVGAHGCTPSSWLRSSAGRLLASEC